MLRDKTNRPRITPPHGENLNAVPDAEDPFFVSIESAHYLERARIVA
jgi:hypothetical protein